MAMYLPTYVRREKWRSYQEMGRRITSVFRDNEESNTNNIPQLSCEGRGGSAPSCLRNDERVSTLFERS